MRGCENWSSTLPNELPLWELESWWTPKSSESNCKGQNPLDWGFPYIIGKILERICLKWACMTQLNIWNISYGQKKGRESNCQIDSQPLKVGNRPDFLVFRWRATYHWKALNKGYNVSLNLISIRGLCTKLWPHKVTKVSILGISRLLGQNDIWVLAPWPGTKYTIRGWWWLPPSSGHGEFRESKFACDLFYHQTCPSYAVTNLLFGFHSCTWDEQIKMFNPKQKKQIMHIFKVFTSSTYLFT
jgi:hypothetical protein